MVADALSRKSYCNAVCTEGMCVKLQHDLEHLNLGIVEHGFVAALEAQPTLVDQIRAAQVNDPEIAELKKNMRVGKARDFHEDEHGTMWLGERLCVPDDKELKDLILTEAHQTVMFVSESKQNIRGPQDCFNLFRSWNGNGKKLAWIS